MTARPLLALAALLLPAANLPAEVLVTLGGGTGVAPPSYQGPSQTTSAGAISTDDRTRLRSTDLRVPCRDGRWTQVASPFALLSDPQVDARMVVMRRMVLHAIEEMKNNGPVARRVAVRLENSYNRNQIRITLDRECCDSTTETFEGTSDPTPDEISLSLRLFLRRGPGNCEFSLFTTEPGFANLRGLLLYAALYHEGLHMMQDFQVPPLGGESVVRREARQKQRLQENELAALDGEAQILQATHGALTLLRSTGRAPTGGSAIARAVAAEYLQAFPDPATRTTVLDQALKELRVEQLRIAFLDDRRREHLSIYTAFLDGSLGAIPFPAVGKMHDALRRSVWSRTLRDGSAGLVTTTARGGTLTGPGGGTVVQPGNVLRQQSSSALIEFPVTGLDFITGLVVALDGTRLLVLGGEESTGDGLLIGYHDTDSDGFFEAATRVEALRSSDLFLATFTRDFATGQVLAFNPETKDLHQLDTSGSATHPYPDFTNYRGSIGFAREDVRRVRISSDGLHAFGSPDCDSATFGDVKWMHSVAPAPGGDFIPAGPWCPSENHILTPIFMVVPGSGNSFIMIRHFPGSIICVNIVFGPERQLIAKTFLITPGTIRISFGQILTPGSVIEIVDGTNHLTSAQQTVWGPVSPPILSPPVFDSSNLFLDLLGNPAADYYLNDSLTLDAWNQLEVLSTDGYGMAPYNALKAPFGPRHFFQAEEIPATP